MAVKQMKYLDLLTELFGAMKGPEVEFLDRKSLKLQSKEKRMFLPKQEENTKKGKDKMQKVTTIYQLLRLYHSNQFQIYC